MDMPGPATHWNQKDRLRLAIILAFALVINVSALKLPFFWDTIHNAQAATWYWANWTSENLAIQAEASGSPAFPLLPNSLDAGHPPGFNLYLAFWWWILGRSLWVSHLAVLPFILGISWQVFRLVKRFIPENFIPQALALILLEPALLAQSTMISPDLALVFFYLSGLNTWLGKSGKSQVILLVLCSLGMSMVSFRGILALAPLSLTGLGISVLSAERCSFRNTLITQFRTFLPIFLKAFLPVTILVLAWWSWHYHFAGWIFSPPLETFGEHRQMAGMGGMLFNTGIFGWRLLDNGRAWLWLFALTATAVFWNKEARLKVKDFQIPLLIFALPIGFFALFFLPFTNPIGHRYLMIGFLLFALMAALLLSRVSNKKIQNLIFSSLCLGLITGHLWVYPDTIAKGWDATLAHLPYHSLRAEMIKDIQQDPELELTGICSRFPNVSGQLYSNLLPTDQTENYWKFKDSEALDSCDFMVQSNIFNGFSDAELQELKTSWILKKEFHRWPVYIRLYEKP